MQKLKLFIWFLLLICLAPPGLSQTLIFKNYSVNQGLASSTVYSVMQDSKGFIWFATESGVNRFDGRNFEVFTIDNGLSDNEILNISEDSKGRIWFLTLNGKLSYYLNGKFFNPENSALLKNAICKASFVSLFEDSKRRLWFVTNQNKLLEIDGQKVQFHSSDSFPLTNAFIFENQDSEICALNTNYFLVLKGRTFIRQDLKELPVSSKAIVNNKLSRSVKYVSSSGLVLYKNGRTSILKYLPEQIPIGSINKQLTDKRNNLWLSTMGEGVYLVKPGKKNPENHLRGNIISDLMIDLQGNIWITTIGNGVFMLPAFAQSTTNLTTEDGLSTNAVQSVLKIDEQLILGLRNGCITFVEGFRIVKQHLKEGSDYNPIKELNFDKQRSSIWFAANNQLGEINLSTEKLNLLREAKNRNFSIKSFSISKSGKIALALASGILIIEDKTGPRSFDTKKQLIASPNFQSRAFSVYYDSQDRLWFANINGLYCYDGSRLLYKNQEPASQRITDITELPDEGIVCSTSGSGVMIFKDFRKIRTISTSNGLASNVCKKVFNDRGQIWVATSKGISYVTLGKDLKVTNYNTENGLTSTEVNDLIVDRDTVYAATNNGLTIFPTDRLQENQIPPKLYFNHFFANKTEVEAERTIVLPYQKNNITVIYNALDFEHPTSLKYSYRLSPELKWSETNANTLEFASLQPGLYQLQIRAKSLNSDWSKPIELGFTIEAPFWKTWWFILLSVTITGTLLFFLTNLYYKSKRAKENEQLLTKAKIISLEQQALQAMMNPHFVFNVMNSIQYFINTKDNAMANQALTGFARLLRKNLENCNKSYITIEEEISYLNLYLSLEKLRFGERMNYSINVDKEISKESTLIPSMLLQPYVENAIWHGLMPKESNGNIWININKTSSSVLEIKIIDDGIGIQTSLEQKTESHISRGMQLTNERIKLLNKFNSEPIKIEIQQLIPEGTQVAITIPIKPFTH